jgi:histidine phosphotransferase ChpT
VVRSIFAPGGDHTSLAAGRGTVIDMRVFALLCARLCHELSGPIGAANNGTESLADEDLDFAHEAVELISASVRQAAGRLQFYRFAYGFSGSGAAAGIEPRELVARLFGESSRVSAAQGPQ